MAPIGESVPSVVYDTADLSLDVPNSKRVISLAVSGREFSGIRPVCEVSTSRHLQQGEPSTEIEMKYVRLCMIWQIRNLNM